MGWQFARVFGIPIFLHPTWIVIFLLVALTLNATIAAEAPGVADLPRWFAAISTALLFFGSILFHELAHSLVALRHRIRVRSITLFVFGGVAAIEQTPDTPRAELEIAIAGPIASGLLALGFSALARLLAAGSADALMFDWLGRINLSVAVFNLLPGLPLDGGRVLRAWLWARRGDPTRATRVSAQVGQLLAYGLIGLGVVGALSGQNAIGGLWLAFIGWFLLTASSATARQAAIEASLEGLRARDLMTKEIAWLDGSAPVGTFARDLVMRGKRWALVGAPGIATGIVTISDVKRIAAPDWDRTPVNQIATPMERVLTSSPGASVPSLLQMMVSREVNQIPIVEGTRILGAVTREAVLQAIQVRATGTSRPLLD
jgi:Zn-dependent protease/predicted transcriptional regulator